MRTHRMSPDVSLRSDSAEVPGLGFLPVSAFVLHAEQPVVVDTGLSTADKDFVADLGGVIDPADVRWVWLTHPDRDHTGGLFDLLDAAPRARVVTTFVGVGILARERGHGATAQVDGHRVGVGNRRLMADENVDLGSLVARRDELAATGRTAVFVAVDGRAPG